MPQVDADTVRFAEWLTIVALLVGPVLAIQVDRLLQRFKESRNHKLDVFHTLMATRGARMSPKHVEALNRIDCEFYRLKPVTAAWRLYLDHLCTPPGPSASPADQSRWQETGANLFHELLEKMAVSLDYEFDKVVLKKGGYYPQGFGDIEFDQQAIRRAARDILEGKQTLKVTVDAQSQQANGVIKPPTSVTVSGPNVL